MKLTLTDVEDALIVSDLTGVVSCGPDWVEKDTQIWVAFASDMSVHYLTEKLSGKLKSLSKLRLMLRVLDPDVIITYEGGDGNIEMLITSQKFSGLMTFTLNEELRDRIEMAMEAYGFDSHGEENGPMFFNEKGEDFCIKMSFEMVDNH